MQSSWPPSVQWFFGSVTSTAADLYLRTEGHPVTEITVSGPRSAYARTLEATLPLASIDAAQGLWRASIEEPCFWTPRQPYLYTAQLTSGDQHSSGRQHTVTLGVPVLVARGRRVLTAGRNCVLRMMRAAAANSGLLDACHATDTSLFADCPDDALCAAASAMGVRLVAELGAVPADRVDSELRRACRWPAVGVAVLPETAEPDLSLLRETAHVVKAQRWTGVSPQAPRPWAQLLVVDRAELSAAAIANAAESLGIIVRTGDREIAAADGGEARVAAARRACDSLQAELARHFGGRREFAGYLVG